MARLALVAVLAFALAACNDDVVARDTVSAEQVEELRDDPGLPIYYAGQSVGGLPLTHADGWTSKAGQALFAYGTCKPPEGDGGCAVPIQIQHFRFKPGQWRLAANCRLLPSLRGVPTARHDGLVLFTGSIVVKIYARGSEEERRVARTLRGINSSTLPGQPLPPPAARVRKVIADGC
jgi:hypothetical protein